jgi:hypothetical protein
VGGGINSFSQILFINTFSGVDLAAYFDAPSELVYVNSRFIDQKLYKSLNLNENKLKNTAVS